MKSKDGWRVQVLALGRRAAALRRCGGGAALVLVRLGLGILRQRRRRRGKRAEAAESGDDIAGNLLHD